MGILIVDDDEADIKALSFCLEKVGLPCDDFALDAEEAIAKIKKNEPSVVLVDVGLAGRNGFYLCEKIKQLSPKIQVILLSGLVNQEKRRLAQKSGAVGIFEKSVGYSDVISLVQQSVLV